MIKRFLVLCLVLFFIGSSLFSQTQKGILTAGTSFNIHYNNYYSNGQIEFRLNPKIGYFIVDNLNIGLDVSFHLDDTHYNFDQYWAVGPYARYFFSFSKFNVFIENSFRYVFEEYYDGLSLVLGPGFSFFLNDFISIENTFVYLISSSFGYPASHDLFFNLGLTHLICLN